jgi:hypothetical protein
MDAAEFFNTVVKRNYEEFTNNPNDFRSLWNAIVSMNTVPEYIAHKDQSLIDLKSARRRSSMCEKLHAATNKVPFTITVTSTIASPVDITT